MNISLEWLKDYVDINLNTEEIVDRIKLHSTNVEKTEKLAQGIKNIVIGKVESVKDHPNADRLIICDVNIGKENIQIVTADKSVKKNHLVPVALDGAILKDGFKIKSRKMRGELSQGMFCSLEEVDLEEKSDEVYKIKEEVPLGVDFVEYFKMNDEIIEIEVFPNRPDLLSYTGIAKELEIIDTAKNFKLPSFKKLNKNNSFDIEITDNNCKRYSAAIIKNIKVNASPLWLVRRLATAGIRSINNIVDITNYIMLETGHPVHAFDLNLIKDKIIVRKAVKGEKILLLDEKEYELMGEETLITDKEKILAIGGVMGGELSGINENTTNILLEVAYFDPVNTRKVSKYHKLSTDASYRFERGIDPNDGEFVMGRLVKLIEEIANGVSDGTITDIYPNKINPKEINLRYTYLNEKLGTIVPEEKVQKIIEKFDFKKEKNTDGWKIFPSTKRPDLEIEVDMIEEIGRVFGYHNIESKLPETTLFHGDKNNFFMFKSEIASLMIGNGYNESITFSFMNINNMWLDKSDLKILNPLSAEYEYMRPLVSYGLLDCLSYNYRNQNRDVKLFEIANIYNTTSDGKTKEVPHLAFVATGKENPNDYTDKRMINYYTFKGVLDNLIDFTNIKNLKIKRLKKEGFSYSQSAEIYINDDYIGFIGLLDSQYADKIYDIKDKVYICEVNLEKIYEFSNPINKENKNFDYPAIKREYSFTVPINKEFEEIEQIIKDSGNIIEKINIFDVYKGKGIDEDKISITITVVYRSYEKTLTDEEINPVEEKFLNKLDSMNINLRQKG